jgi:hypothetical protein
MKWVGANELTGGSTPKALQVRKMMSVGWPALQGMRAFLDELNGVSATGVLAPYRHEGKALGNNRPGLTPASGVDCSGGALTSTASAAQG